MEIFCKNCNDYKNFKYGDTNIIEKKGKKINIIGTIKGIRCDDCKMYNSCNYCMISNDELIRRKEENQNKNYCVFPLNEIKKSCPRCYNRFIELNYLYKCLTCEEYILRKTKNIKSHYKTHNQIIKF